MDVLILNGKLFTEIAPDMLHFMKKRSVAQGPNLRASLPHLYKIFDHKRINTINNISHLKSKI